MLDQSYRRYVQSFLLVLPMTGIVCAINTIVAKGLGAVFTVGLLERWAISCIIAWPLVIVLAPRVAKLTDRIVKPG